jgi:hypothetical protein
MKLKKSAALLALAPLFLLSGCVLFPATPTIVSAEYYGPDSFKLGHTGEWASSGTVNDIPDIQNTIFVKSTGTGDYYTIISNKQVEMASSFKTNYDIVTVNRNWTPGDTIVVSYTDKKCEFHVPDTQ